MPGLGVCFGGSVKRSMDAERANKRKDALLSDRSRQNTPQAPACPHRTKSFIPRTINNSQIV